MGVLEVLNRHGKISSSDDYIITRPPNTVAQLTTDYISVTIRSQSYRSNASNKTPISDDGRIMMDTAVAWHWLTAMTDG